MPFAECPSCDSKVTLSGHVRMGKRVVCPSCDAPLEVVWLEPLELDWLYDDEEYEEYDEDESDYEELRY